jgi:hypothetical protein
MNEINVLACTAMISFGKVLRFGQTREQTTVMHFLRKSQGRISSTRHASDHARKANDEREGCVEQACIYSRVAGGENDAHCKRPILNPGEHPSQNLVDHLLVVPFALHRRWNMIGEGGACGSYVV